MRLIDADKLMADDTFCEGIECDMCSLSYIDDVYHCRACGVTKWIINQPTVCDIEQIRAEIRQIVDAETEHDEKWARGLHYALCVIDRHIGRTKDEI